MTLRTVEMISVFWLGSSLLLVGLWATAVILVSVLREALRLLNRKNP